MTRLIDADALRMTFEGKHEYVEKSDIDDAPTVDAIPVIRCKDCKYCRDYCRIIEDVKYEHACALKEECGYPYGQFRVSEDDYCSRAERKEE